MPDEGKTRENANDEIVGGTVPESIPSKTNEKT
jgi:hypothetical protein